MRFTRREALRGIAGGFGMVGLGGALKASTSPWTVKAPHFAPKAKHVIFLFLNGGLSQIDSFDYKPQLEKLHGQPMPGGDLQHERKTGNLMKSPFEFKR